MKKWALGICLSLSISGSAFGCMDIEAYEVEAIPLAGALRNNASFNKCIRKLLRAGVDLESMSAFRKDRSENETGPILYSLRLQGPDRRGQMTHIRLDYSLPRHQFLCGAVSRTVSRSGTCF